MGISMDTVPFFLLPSSAAICVSHRTCIIVCWTLLPVFTLAYSSTLALHLTYLFALRCAIFLWLGSLLSVLCTIRHICFRLRLCLFPLFSLALLSHSLYILCILSFTPSASSRYPTALSGSSSSVKSIMLLLVRPRTLFIHLLYTFVLRTAPEAIRVLLS